jgi:hypothetical protein
MPLSFWLGRLRAALAQFTNRRQHRTGAGRPPGGIRLAVEALEDRTVPTTFTVTNTLGDATVGSLAWAINQVNADTTVTAANPDTINFNITADRDAAAGGTGFNATTGVATISPSWRQVIVNPVLIDGYTQVGASPNKLLGPPPLGSTDSTLNPQNYGDNAVLKIQINGAGGGGELALAGNNITVQGLDMNSIGIDPIAVFGAGDVVQGNFLGTDVTGKQALGNGGADIYVYYGVNVTIGGTTPAARNVISGAVPGPIDSNNFGYGDGIFLVGTSVQAVVQGNFIGTDVTGTKSLGNSDDGILIISANNLIGGSTPGAGNVISGNDHYGINEFGGGDLLEGNFIGTDVTGTKALAVPNSSYGIFLQQGGGVTIGAPSAGNLISGNSGGVRIDTYNNVIQANFIGTDVTGTQLVGGQSEGVYLTGTPNDHNNTIGGNVIAGGGNGVGVDVGATANAILGNSIYDHGGSGLGINLYASGANNNQAAPVLTSALSSSTGTTITGTLAGYANSSFHIEFFSNPTGASGQGQIYLGAAQITTDAQGNFTATLATALTPGTNLAATATDAGGNTSEFSANNITVKGALTVNANTNLLLLGNNPAPLTGSVNGTPFTSPFVYTTPWGDTITITLSTAATSASFVGQYPITATFSGANLGNYVINLTPGTMYVVSVGADPTSTTGAQTVTFWDNKGNKSVITTAELTSLDALNLVNQGGAAFDPHSVAQLQSWLSVSPNAATSYQLAVQLAVLDLNVLAGNVQATDLVYGGGLLPYATADQIAGLTTGGFIDVQNLMNAANAILGVDPKATTGDPNQAYEAALTQVLQSVNSNTNFVSQDVWWSLFGVYSALTA